MSVGGDHPNAPGVGHDLEVDAIDVVSRLVHRSGIHGAFDHLREDGCLEAHHPPRRELGQARILRSIGARQREARTAAADVEVGIRRRLELDRLVGQLTHDVVELARGDRDRAGLLHLGRLRAADANLEVRRRELETPAVALTARRRQDVGENRHGAAFLDDGLETREAALEIHLVDGELHGFTSFTREFQVVEVGTLEPDRTW